MVEQENEHEPTIVPFKFHGVPAKQFIADQLIRMGRDVSVHLWKEIPSTNHKDDPPDEKIDLSEFTLRAAVQVLDDYKLAVNKQARFYPHGKGYRGQLWKYSKGPGQEVWRFKSNDKRTKKWGRTPCIDDMKEDNPLELDDDSEGPNEEEEQEFVEEEPQQTRQQIVEGILSAIALPVPAPVAV